VELRPNIDRAWYGMGLALAALARHHEAAAALEEAARLQPMNPYAWYHLGMAYHVSGQPAKREETVAHLERFDPRMAERLRQDAGKG
jgi:tetratricopeptide (TPR) repeat protein